MLRRAVVNRLTERVAGLGGRVYQAFLAPADAGRPYATVKLPQPIRSADIGYAGNQEIEVRLYTDPTSFTELDELEVEVMATLNGATVVDDYDGGAYYLEAMPGGADFNDEDKSLIGRLLRYATGTLSEPGGD